MRIPIRIIALWAALGACAQPVETIAGDFSGGAYSVRLRNDGAVALRNVRVTTGQNVPPLTTASLDAGASTGLAPVSVLHEHPIVSATVNGKSSTFTPVEGFAGFNAQVPPGSYVIRLRYVTEYGIIDTRVERDARSGSP